MKNILKNRIMRFVFASFCVVSLMYISFVISYNIMRKGAPSQKSESAPDVQNENYSSEKPFPNLPVTISGTYEENADFSSDTNDYLVIYEGNLVNLYAIDNNENKTFERVLEIDINSLIPADRMLLEKGLLLPDKASVLALIEDYSS